MTKFPPKSILNKEPIIRTNISFPKSLHKQVKQCALDEETTINALVLKAVKKSLISSNETSLKTQKVCL